MRVRLDNGKDYDINAMFTLSQVGQAKAWEAMRKHYSTWSNALTLPLKTQATTAGLLKWLLVLILHSLSLLTLPFLFIVGCSMKSYTVFLNEDAKKMTQYKADLQRIYAELNPIKDKDEYQKRLKEEIAKVKPF
ncbi:MAG: hypothetical protein ACI84K_000511 [Pseudohongiellaceae bacterium]|jgi:hypothetical protein